MKRIHGILLTVSCAVVLFAAHPVTAEPERATTARLTHLMRDGVSPANRDELRALQGRIRDLTAKIMPATVAIQVGRANGSGVIIDSAGHVLTAAHVAGRPGRAASIYLPDGRVVHGVTQGLNQKLDAGMIQITDQGKWPYVGFGKSADLQEGQWCLATGHPGGFAPGRPPVLRWGRILKSEESAILTDCTLVGGDSGGPLFDLSGRVIGIHSRIGKNLTINVHVPVDPFRESWDRLVSGDVWGLLEESSEAGQGGWLGVIEDPSHRQARVLRVAPDSPAAASGILAGDVIERLDDVPVAGFRELQSQIASRAPGDTVRVQVRREETLIDLHVQLSARP